MSQLPHALRGMRRALVKCLMGWDVVQVIE
jgi:hypothetical protein